MNRTYDAAFNVANVVNTWLPEEIWQEVTEYSHSNLINLSLVNKEFEALIKKYAENHRVKYCFGKVQWLSFGGDPGIEPFLPLRMIQDFDHRHQMLTLIPETINNEMLTLRSIDAFVSKSKNTDITNYIYPHGNSIIDNIKVEKVKSHWVLLSKTVLDGTEDQLFETQEELLNIQGFEIPNLIDTVVSLLMHNRKTGEFVYPHPQGCPWKATYVQEMVNYEYRIVVGAFSALGLNILSKRNFCYESIGIACARTHF